MQEENSYIGGLIIKVALKEDLEEKELADLHIWQDRSSYHQEVLEQFRDGRWVMGEIQEMRQFPMEEEWQRLMGKIESDTPSIPSIASVPLWKSPRVWKYSAAAVLFLLCILALYLWQRPHEPSTPGKELAGTPKNNNPGIPKNYRVALIRADSDTLVLDTAHHYKQAAPPDGNGPIYTTIPAPTLTPSYNTLNTRQAAPFDLSLPDGSKIKLSYASSLRYPVDFRGGTREVTLTGEAYFEIAPNAEKPFIVYANGTKIEVLGTAFNIMAYPEEPVSEISVFNGSVKVMRGEHTVQLHPFEQASVTSDELKTGKIADSAAVMAWSAKQPAFAFRNTDLPAALREIARWHKLKVYSPDDTKGITITARFYREEPLKEILHTLEEIEGGNAYLTNRHDSIILSATRQPGEK